MASLPSLQADPEPLEHLEFEVTRRGRCSQPDFEMASTVPKVRDQPFSLPGAAQRRAPDHEAAGELDDEGAQKPDADLSRCRFGHGHDVDEWPSGIFGP